MADIVLERGAAGRTHGKTAGGARKRGRTADRGARRSRAGVRNAGGRTAGGRESGALDRTSRRLMLLIAVLALALIGELTFHFVIAPELSITEISVESEVAFADEELLRVAGLGQAPAYFAVDAAEVARNLETYPSVQAASVEKVFPNRLEISITGRKPLLVTLAASESGSVPVAVDGEGVVFEIGGNLADVDLPLVSGIRFEGFSPGVQLPAMLHEFLSDIRQLRMEHPLLFEQISEYRIVRTGEHSFDVLLYTVSYRTPVRIGSEVDGALCKYIIMVLDALDRDGRLAEIEELDFRTGQIVYRTKEG
ncbi:MAG: FtsQ-type POTRA domain-containing protein [Spirochaetes bacterium]|nr:FtsQ-type POTRA domain-containing protein [Spirochaetota bacterium]